MGSVSLPNGWTIRTISELGRIVTGRTPPTGNQDYYGGAIPFVTPSDMDDRKVISTTLRYLTPTGLTAIQTARVPAGTVMTSCIGSDMGKSAIAGADCATNQQINSVVVQEGGCSDFVYYSLKAQREELRHQAAGGSAQPILNKTDFGKLRIILPPLPEQRAIAHVLGTLDDKIENNRRMNATLEAMARAIFKSWFVDFDPVRAKAEGRAPAGMDAATAALFPDRFEDSALGKIPQGWRVGTVGDIAYNPRRGVQPNEVDPATPYIALEHMPRRCIALSDWGTVDGVVSGKFAFKAGEILFGKLRPYFHKVGVAPLGGVCSTDILVIALKEDSWGSFVLGHVASDELVAHADASSTGTKMPRSNWADIARYTVALPSQQIAEAFNRVVQPWLALINTTIHAAKPLAALRDALLPKLLSGEVRVGEAEAAVGNPD